MEKKKSKEVESERLLSFHQLADILGMSYSYLRKAKKDYNLPHYKLGGAIRFRLSEVNEWLRQRKAA